MKRKESRGTRSRDDRVLPAVWIAELLGPGSVPEESLLRAQRLARSAPPMSAQPGGVYVPSHMLRPIEDREASPLRPPRAESAGALKREA